MDYVFLEADPTAVDGSMPMNWAMYQVHPVRFASANECFNFLDTTTFHSSFDVDRDAFQIEAQPDDDVSSVYCNATWDRTLCWPSTPANTTVKLPCPPWFLGLDKTKFSYRTCDSTGQWEGDPSGKYSQQLNPNGWTNYLECYPDWIKNDLSVIKTISFGARVLETIGLAISLITLAVSIVTFFYFKNLRCDRIRIHRNLFVAVIVHVTVMLVKNIDQLVALTQSGKTTDMKSMVATGSLDSSIDHISVVCQLLIFGVEYTKTVVFAWMFIEGLYLHNKLVVSVFAFKPNYMLYHLIGWGLPLIVTGTWSIVFTFKSENRCWFAYTNKPYFWILEAPRISVIAVNMIFLLNILRIVVTKLRESNTAETEQIRKAVKAALVLLPLLGANHLLAITGPSDYSPTLYGLWAFTSFLLTASQGFIIALLYCFLNTEVRNVVFQHIQRRKVSRAFSTRSFNGKATSTAMTSFLEVRNSSCTIGPTTKSLRQHLPTLSEEESRVATVGEAGKGTSIVELEVNLNQGRPMNDENLMNEPDMNT